eukprot:PhF_6_TR40695/c0_g1_i3/m.61174
MSLIQLNSGQTQPSPTRGALVPGTVPAGGQLVPGSAPNLQPLQDAQAEAALNVLKELRKQYETVLKPLEVKCNYDGFRPSWFSEVLVQTKPMITFLGPFSSGKSTFINYLLQGNFLLTGPQPTTDRFTVIMHGTDTCEIPGRILAASADQPYRGLQHMGDAFLECFGGLQVNHELLKSVTIVDTPGVLEAAGGVHARRYDYVKACRWFVERSDLVFILFDPTKLDAGQELRMMFKHALKNCESKVRIVLNKADGVGPQELMKVYGSLFWNLSVLMNTTEPPRVYVSSFWDQPYKPYTNAVLFTEEKADLLYDITEVVPLQCVDKKVAALVRRAQDVMIHASIIGTIRAGMPMFFGKDKAKAKALENMDKTFEAVAIKYKLVAADFPQVAEYKTFFEKLDVYDMPTVDQMASLIEAVRKMTEETLPRLLKPIKTTTVNPADRKHTVRLQKAYFHQMQAQLQGVGGFQGPAETMAPPPQRPSVVVQEASTMNTGGDGGGGNPIVLPQNLSRAQVQQLITMLTAMQGNA